ncbi:cadherin-like domain-containing protein [Stieleria neptunia]|uniref:cadherin-like domain-containing protein n=1 Tax=Stieleria neptunia TaxID=2527979 RepID=UPI0018D23F7B|nr:cadherin-like domain-containing protein [Stieleria neptunia]
MRLPLAIDTYFVDLSGLGTTDIFGPTAGGEVQEVFVDHPKSDGGVIGTAQDLVRDNAQDAAIQLPAVEVNLLADNRPIVNSPSELFSIALEIHVGPISVIPGNVTSVLGATVTLYADGSYLYDASTSEIVLALQSGELADDQFDYVVVDSEGSTTTFTANLRVIGKNDGPSLNTSAIVTVGEGRTASLAAVVLDGSDPDTPADQLVYEVTDTPSNGQLEFIDAIGVQVSTFTQADVDNLRMVYVHNGTETIVDQFSVSLSDGGGDGAPPATGAVNIVILQLNDPPGRTGAWPGTIDVPEDGAAYIDLSAIELYDAENSDLTLTLETSGGVLMSDAQANVVVNGSGTTELSIAGSPTDVNEFLDLANEILYVPPEDVSGPEADRLKGSLSDGQSTSTLGTATISIADVNDLAQVISLETTELTFQSGEMPITVSQTIDVFDPDHIRIQGAAIAFTSLYVGGEDELTFTAQNGIAGNFDPVSGILTLNGDASIEDYVDALRSVQYQNVSTSTTPGKRTVSFSVDDGQGFGPQASRNISVSVGPPPILTLDADNSQGATPDVHLNFVENSGVRLLSDQSGISDGDDSQLQEAEIFLTDRPDGSDEGLTIAGTLPPGIAVDSVSSAQRIVLRGTASLSAYEQAIDAVGYYNTSENPSTNQRRIEFTVNDGSSDGPKAVAYLTIQPTNDLPRNAGGLPSEFFVAEDVQSFIDWSSLTLVDEDDDPLTLRLSASSGTLASVNANNVVVGGSETNMLTLSGTASSLNAFLDQPNRIEYLGAENLFGTRIDSITAAVSDPDNLVVIGSADVTISAVNDPPVLATNNAITVSEGEGVTLSRDELAEDDPDDEGAEIRYSIVSGPANGYFEATSFPFIPINSFTQDDIDNGRVTYRHDGSETSSDLVRLNLADGGEDGATSVDFDFIVNVTPVNDDPYNAGSTVPDAAVTEDTLSPINLSALDIADSDAPVSNHQLTLSVEDGFLQVSGVPTIDVLGNGTGTVTLIGSLDDLNSYLDNPLNLNYLSGLDLFGDDADLLTVTINDGGNTGNGGGNDVALASVNLDISAVNDAPTNIGTLLSDLSVTEDLLSPLDLSGLQIADVDVGTDDLTVTVSVANGTLQLVVDPSLVLTGNGTGTATLTGTLTELNNYLDIPTNISFVGALNAAGNDATLLSVTVNDNGNTGSGGGSDVTLASVNLDIAAINDAPTNIGSSLTDLSVIEDLASPLNLSGLQIADVDAATNDLTVTLSVASGTLQLTVDPSVVLSGNGTALATLTGTLTELNSYLDNPNNIRFLGPLNVSGNDATLLSVTVNDNGNGGSGGGNDVTFASVNLDIAAVNDAPFNAGAIISDLNVTEDFLSSLNLSGLEIADNDAGTDDLTVTVSVASGTLQLIADPSVDLTGNGTATATLIGTLSELNNYLDNSTNIRFLGTLNANGNDATVLSVTADDGAGDVTLASVNLDISAVNDAPTNIGSALSDLSVTEDLLSSLNLSGLEIADVDAGTNDLTVTVNVASGTLQLVVDPSVVLTGNGTGTATLTGTLTELNNYLDVPTNINFLGALNAAGNDATLLSVTVNDNGNTGSGAGSDVTLASVNVDISAVNDDPTNIGSALSDLSVTEDLLSSLNLSGLEIADVDAGTNDLTVTVSVASGTLQLVVDPSVVLTGNGTGTATLTGTLTELNNYLDVPTNISFLGALNAAGNDATLLSVTVNDNGNTGSGSGSDVTLASVNLDISAVNDAPTNIGSALSDLSVTEDLLSSLNLSGLEIADVDAGTNDLTVTVNVASGTLQLVVDPSVVLTGNGTSAATLTGTLTELNNYLDVPTNINFLGALNAAGNDATLLSVTVNDNGNTGSGSGSDVTLASVNLDISAVNDDPTNIGSALSDLSVTEDLLSSLNLSGLEIADVDAGTNDLTVTVSVASGTLQLVVDPSVVLTGNGTGTATLTGTLTELNNYLDVPTNISFLGALNAAGNDATLLSVTVNDNGNTGSGSGSDVTLASVNLDISAVNDDPTNIGSALSDLSVTEDLLSSLNLSGLEIADVDAGTNDLTVTVSVASGTLQLVVDPSVVLTGNGTGTATLTGTLTELNNYLDVPTNISFLGALNAAGNDATLLSVTVNDNGNTGSGTGSDVTLASVNVDISAVNDDPTNIGSALSDLSVTEDLLSSLNLSGLEIADVDAGTNDLTVTVSVASGTLQLVVDPSVVLTGNGTGTATLTGTLTELNNYLDVPTNISFLGALNAAGNDATLLSVTVNDNGNTGSGSGSDVTLASVNLDISAVNDAPTNIGSALSDLSVTEDLLSSLNLSGLEIADVDAGTNDLTVTVNVASGTLQLVVDPSVVLTGNGTSAATLTGTLTELNNYLDVPTNISFLGALNAAGNDATLLSVTVNDNGNTGSGAGSDVTLASVNLDISAVNDDPVNVGTLPSDLNVVSGLLSGLDIGTIELVDVDAAGGTLSVTIESSLSPLTVLTGGGVTATGSGTNAVSLTGTVDALNTYFDTPTNILLLPLFGLLGDNQDLLTIKVNDGGNTGTGGGSDLTLGTINIDVVLSPPPIAALSSFPDQEVDDGESSLPTAAKNTIEAATSRTNQNASGIPNTAAIDRDASTSDWIFAASLPDRTVSESLISLLADSRLAAESLGET